MDAAHYALEVKWDGIRAIVYIDDTIRVTGRRGTDFTPRYPEISALRVPGHRVILDGEVVAFDQHGRPSFELLQRRMHITDPGAHGLLATVPVAYMPFDLLYLDGETLYHRPYQARRELLEGLAGLTVPPNFPCDPAVLDATYQQGLEGVVAKRLDSPYRPGVRTPWWIKVKNLHTQEVVIGGWRPGKGRREGGIGSLLLGAYADLPGGAAEFAFVGHVGTGFTDAALDRLYQLLRPLEVPRSTYSRPLPRDIARGAHWVRPELVGEVGFTMWTEERRLRHPTWRGLRPDKIPAEVRL
ncbi:non-homologous end-joining DNA ligase [Acrocarpospora catenulata]|uniref:non-homologous end-joining DNA ligase n=1 Tax=Acrocarpospora catenulata TaxID=2836182 RepID=UPI0027E1DE72|nr:non-homologous end-joining DNA ligase [Acrocarpospora catenulata]